MKYLLITLFFLFSCDKEQEYLEVYYMKQNSLTAINIPCDMVKPDYYGIKYMKIQDKKFIEQFKVSYLQLKDTKKVRRIDTRIRIIYHKGNKMDTICMGEYFTIFVNGELKEDSPKLLKLIKDRIYN